MKFCVIVTALLASTVTASAADLAPAPVEPIAPAALPFSWLGFYAGGHVGGGWARDHDNQSEVCGGGGGSNGGGSGGGSASSSGSGNCGTSSVSDGGLDRFSLKGLVGGFHAGYNFYQADRLVVGVEGDIDYTNLRGSAHGHYGTSYRTLALESNWQGSARLRVGYVIDRFLPYLTGGIAVAQGKLTNSGLNSDVAIPTTHSTKTHIGWTVGLGAEYALTDHWIGRAEMRYTDFGKKNSRTADGAVKAGWDQVTGTIGLSYKF